MAKKETPDCGKHCKPPTEKRLAYHCNKICCHGRPVPGHYRGRGKTPPRHKK